MISQIHRIQTAVVFAVGILALSLISAGHPTRAASQPSAGVGASVYYVLTEAGFNIGKIRPATILRTHAHGRVDLIVSALPEDFSQDDYPAWMQVTTAGNLGGTYVVRNVAFDAYRSAGTWCPLQPGISESGD